jgi:glycosyltransferase involved in cell wall biosynthesis
MRISIVTPTLNRAHMLGEAIESVLRQGYEDFEHIVVDGLSTDATPALLARYPHVRVIRERDSGLYDALNKGIRVASGQVVGHLNSDDRYTPGAFRRIVNAFSKGKADVVSGGAEILAEGERVKHRFQRADEIALNFENVTTGALIPNARFFKRSFYERVGLYDLSYRVAADREFMFRAVLAQPRARVVEEVVYQYRWHAESLTFSDNPEQEARWRDEYLRLAESWLRLDLPAKAMPHIRRWHEQESAQAAARAMLSGKYAAARAYAASGFRVNKSWPVMFARHLGGALLGR